LVVVQYVISPESLHLYFLLNDHSKKTMRCYSVIGHTSASPVRHRPRVVSMLGLTQANCQL